jgi:hypothetical protein
MVMPTVFGLLQDGGDLGGLCLLRRGRAGLAHDELALRARVLGVVGETLLAGRGLFCAFGRALQAGGDAVQVRVRECDVERRRLAENFFELARGDVLVKLGHIRRGLVLDNRLGLFRLRLDCNRLHRLAIALRLRLGRLDVAEIDGIETGGRGLHHDVRIKADPAGCGAGVAAVLVVMDCHRLLSYVGGALPLRTDDTTLLKRRRS